MPIVDVTPNSVVMQLLKLGRDLDEITSRLDELDRTAVEKREAHDLAFARATLEASGSNAETRKAKAVEDTHDTRIASELADVMVRQAKRQIDAIKVRIDIGRTAAAALRAEIELTKTGFNS